jgi:uncharacterized protein (DUF885 family)
VTWVPHSQPVGLADRPRRPDGLPEPRTPFEGVVVDVLADLFRAHPTWATSVGYHAVDGQWPALGPGAREDRVRMLRDHEGALGRLDEATLSSEERLDRELLAWELEKARFSEEVLAQEAWDPLALVYLMGSGLFGLLARDYAPWERRATALLERLRGLPALARDGLAALVGLPGRPVSLLHLETALRQLSGVDEVVSQALEEARRRAAAGEAADLVAPLEAAAVEATRAIAALRAGLDRDVRPRAEGEGRLGAELFTARLRHALAEDLAPDELRRQAWQDYTVVRAEMVRLARGLWPRWVPDDPLPDADPADPDAESRIVRRVLDAIAQEHPSPEDLLERCRDEVARIEAFCRERDLIGLPDEPLEVAWTPAFMRAYGRAFLDSPGPLDRGQRAHFWVTPPDPAEGPAAVESYLREDNDRMLRVLCIHEAIPGHYLQLARSNRSDSLVRAVFTDGMFAEGWAVYVTQVMMDEGYGADDGALMLTHWKMYLRAAINAILDAEVHTAGMEEADALDLMVRGGFQEEDEARAKWLRARITATQLSTYFVGSRGMWDLEIDARRRAAVAAGATADAVPPQRIVGGLGPTPGFDRRAHLEAVIAHGTPPIAWVRRILLA